jgi:hypothetical protein
MSLEVMGDIVIPQTHETSVYENEDGSIVISQRRDDGCGFDDMFVVIPRMFAKQLIKAIRQAASPKAAEDDPF